jgi:uncharacterized protein YdeI (YjbR/CyaY-like superfamily)
MPTSRPGRRPPVPRTASGPPEATFFSSPAEFRRWLQRHHASARELWVGFHKKATGRQTITWAQAVDEALCFGWIDGVRKSVDGDRYANRFTPRRRGSTWSLVNTRRAQELIAEGRMRPAGLRAFEARDPARSGLYSFERANAALTPDAEARFRAETAAWQFFQAQPPGYRRTVLHWVTSARQQETRDRRLDILIRDCRNGERIGPLRRPDRAAGGGTAPRR